MICPNATMSRGNTSSTHLTPFCINCTRCRSSWLLLYGSMFLGSFPSSNVQSLESLIQASHCVSSSQRHFSSICQVCGPIRLVGLRKGKSLFLISSGCHTSPQSSNCSLLTYSSSFFNYCSSPSLMKHLCTATTRKKNQKTSFYPRHLWHRHFRFHCFNRPQIRPLSHQVYPQKRCRPRMQCPLSLISDLQPS